MIDRRDTLAGAGHHCSGLCSRDVAARFPAVRRLLAARARRKRALKLCSPVRHKRARVRGSSHKRRARNGLVEADHLCTSQQCPTELSAQIGMIRFQLGQDLSHPARKCFSASHSPTVKRAHRVCTRTAQCMNALGDRSSRAKYRHTNFET